MSVKGHYTLQLACEGNNYSCMSKEDVISEDQRSAMLRARQLGWRITAFKVVCPTCTNRRQPTVEFIRGAIRRGILER